MAGTQASARKGRLATWVGVAHAAIFALCLWTLADHSAPFIALLAVACCPVAATLVAQRSGDEILLMQAGRSDSRPDLTLFLYVPCFVLFVRGLIDFNIVDWWQPLLAAVLLGIAFALLAGKVIARQEKKQRTRRAVAVFAFLLLVGAGTAWSMIVETNGLGEAAAPTATRMAVVAKREQRSTRSHSYYFTLRSAPSPPEEYLVSSDLYARTEPGRTRCVFIHSGIFALRWYSVGLCPGDGV
jgi:hypothetical protein